MESSNQFLGTERIGKLMQKYAIPCIISLLVGALYNIVDQIFIANASYLGSYGNAANTVVFPLTVVALAIAVMIGDGCCAFVSISLGQNEVPKAKRSVGNAVVMCLVSSIVLAALYLIFADNILAMFGGTVNAETYHHSQEYFFYITLGIPFYMFGQAMNPIIRADGSPRFAMVSTLAGAVLNIILDPIFIFGLRWGMMGAAVATVIGQVVTAALAVWYLLHMKIIRPAWADLRLKGSICGRTLTLGMTSFLSQISLVAAMAAINNMIRKYGALDAVFGQEQYAQIPMAVVGIVMKFFQIVISIVVGMAAGCIPVVGFNMGAKKPTRVKELFTKLLLAEATVGAVALVLVELLPRQLIALFGAANESVYYTDFAVKSFRIYLCMIILACVNKACFIFLQAMGKAAESTALSMVREVVFGVGFALLLPRFFGLDGVLYSMPLSDILTFLIAGYLICKTYRELNQKGEVYWKNASSPSAASLAAAAEPSASWWQSIWVSHATTPNCFRSWLQKAALTKTTSRRPESIPPAASLLLPSPTAASAPPTRTCFGSCNTGSSGNWQKKSPASSWDAAPTSSCRTEPTA